MGQMNLHSATGLTRIEAHESLATISEAGRRELVIAGRGQFAATLLDALKPGKPCQGCGRSQVQVWAMRLFARIAKYVDATPQIVIAIWQQLGVRDEGEAKAIIGTHRSLERMSEEDRVTLCAEFVKAWNEQHPERRVEV